jgi:HEAT repeat protein
MRRHVSRFTPWLLALAACLAGPWTSIVQAQPPTSRNLLKDPAPAVRLRAALALAETDVAEAVPVLIDLLAELSAEQRPPVEEVLTRLAGEWAPVLEFARDDEISRRIRRDAWAGWWRHTDGAALLAAIRRHTLTPEKRARLDKLLVQLGHETFAVRESASAELFALDRLALPHLREAKKSSDAEVARRAALVIERIEAAPTPFLPLAAIRLLAIRKPAGAVASLLEYLPYAEDDERGEEVQKALTALARTEDGKPEAVLLKALGDGERLRRIAAAEALAKGGGAEGRSAVRKLLREEDPLVRLRVALALVSAREREAVPVLIDLLAVLPAAQLGEIEDALQQLAGDSAPSVSAGEKAEERKKYRDGWAAWWKANGDRIDLGRLSNPPLLGYTLISDYQGNRIFEIGRDGKERWAIATVGGPVDAVVLPGQHILIAEYSANRVTERDFKGNILWQKAVELPVNAQRLPNGNTFIATHRGSVLEVDRTGKEIYAINHIPGNVQAGYRTPRGLIFCTTQNGQCLLLDAAGKQLKSFASGHDNTRAGALVLLPGGRLLVAQHDAGKVVEFDGAGNRMRQWDAPAVVTATPLPNGHLLVTSDREACVRELDGAGKVVWQHKGDGNGWFYRARRR